MGRPRIWASDADRKAAARLDAGHDVGRLAAVEIGRRLGAETAIQLREDTHQSGQRVARAMAYAAWEFDGKPADAWAGYEAEFGVVASVPVMASLERPPVKA